MARKTGGVPSRSASPVIWEPRQLVTASRTLTLQDGLIPVDSTAAPVDLTLLPASSFAPGTIYEIAQVAGNNPVRLLPTGTDTINGINAPFDFFGQGIAGMRIATDGAGAWQIFAAFGQSKARANRIASGQVTIGAGTNTITSANLGLGSLAGKPVVCQANQAAPDATAVAFSAIGNAGGTVTVTSSVNATAGTVVGFIVDAR